MIKVKHHLPNLDFVSEMLAAFRSNEGLGLASLARHTLESLPSDLPLQSAKAATYSLDGKLFGYICSEG
jgi:hypothetical protein